AGLVEAGELGVVERARRGAADGAHAAAVEPETCGTGHGAGGLVDRGLEHETLGREPVSLVDHLRVARHERVAEGEDLTVERGRRGAGRGAGGGGGSGSRRVT